MSADRSLVLVPLLIALAVCVAQGPNTGNRGANPSGSIVDMQPISTDGYPTDTSNRTNQSAHGYFHECGYACSAAQLCLNKACVENSPANVRAAALEKERENSWEDLGKEVRKARRAQTDDGASDGSPYSHAHDMTTEEALEGLEGLEALELKEDASAYTTGVLDLSGQ